jgi:hypothetical protein
MLLYNLIKEKIFKNNKFVFLNLNPVNILLLSSIVIYCVPTYTLIIDPRYLIFPLIIIGLYLLSNTGYMKVNRTFQFLIVFTLAFYIYDSVSCIHDNMLKGRIRRDALNYLENDLQISPDKIDGGFEYNAWHFYKPDFQETNAKKWWYVYDDEYIVTNNINKEYILLKSYDVPRWQPSGFVCKVYIWKRKQ